MAATPSATRQAWINPSRWARIAGVIALVIAGALFSAPTDSSRHDRAFLIGYHAAGSFLALVLLALIGTIAFILRRRGNHPRPWSSVTFSAAPMIVTLGIVVALNASRFANHQAAVERAEPNPSGTALEREHAQRDAAAWLASLAPIKKHRDAWLADHNVLLQIVRTAGNTSAAGAKAAEARAELVQMLTLAQGVEDVPEQDLNDARDQLVKLMQLRLHGYDLYVKALKVNARKAIPLADDQEAQLLFDRGDATFDRALALSNKLGTKLASLQAKYAGD